MQKEISKISKGRRLELALEKKEIRKSELAERMGKKKQQVNKWCKNSEFSLATLEDILKVISMTMPAFWSIEETKNDGAN